MGIKFGTDEWVEAAMNALNNSSAYKKAAIKWEGDFYFIVSDKNDGSSSDIIMYMDLWHGECRNAALIHDPSEKSPAFVMSAPLPVWKSIFSRKLDPIKGMMTKKLVLKGNKMKVLKAPKAAIEMVNCCASIDTEW